MAEPAPPMSPLAGKGKRVTGTFLLMLGAGIVLESTVPWLGGALMLAGGAALLRGLLAARPRAAADARAHGAPVAHVTIDPQN